MLVSSLKRVRAVGRWRSLVRSLVSAAAAAAGSGAAVPSQGDALCFSDVMHLVFIIQQ